LENLVYGKDYLKLEFQKNHSGKRGLGGQQLGDNFGLVIGKEGKLFSVPNSTLSCSRASLIAGEEKRRDRRCSKFIWEGGGEKKGRKRGGITFDQMVGRGTRGGKEAGFPIRKKRDCACRGLGNRTIANPRKRTETRRSKFESSLKKGKGGQTIRRSN